MSTSVLQSTQTSARSGKAAQLPARAAIAAGGVLAFSALALSSAQFYRVAAAKYGPGSFLLTIPKHIGAALAPQIGVMGAAGAVSGLAALRLRRGERAEGASRLGMGVPLVVAAGTAAAAMSAAYTQGAVGAHGDFAGAFGADWQERIPAQLRGGLLRRRWTWKLALPGGVRVERDVVFATVPGSERKLLADLWLPPSSVEPSGLALIYLHGGGYSAFDKGGPTEPWFRHLAGQGHVVMDVAYRLIPEATVPEMQGDVKRAIVWLKRNAARYGVNPHRIVLSGGSAGSHLALLAAYAPYHPLFTPEDVRDADLAVRGVIGFYNAGDYRQESRPNAQKTAWQEAMTGLLVKALEGMSGAKVATDATGDWEPRLFLGGAPDGWTELYRQISPIVHVGPDTPPTLQIVGEHDVYGAAASAAALHAELQRAGVPSVLLQIGRTDHAFDLFFPQFSPAAQTAMYDVDRFLALLAAPDGSKREARREQTASRPVRGNGHPVREMQGDGAGVRHVRM